MCKAERGGLTHDTLDLMPGEHIIGIETRTGAWFDAMCFKTSKGRELRKGGGGGGGHVLQFVGKSYLIAIEGDCDDHVKNIKCYYVDLNEVKVSTEDPLMSLIAQSDLLSRGVEKKFKSVFSKETIQHLKDFEEQYMIELLDHDALKAAEEKDGSKQAEGMMIDTAGGDDAELEEADQVIQDIITGNKDNEILITLITVLNKVVGQRNMLVRNGIGGPSADEIVRATFAVIVKLAGLSGKLLEALTMLEI